MSRHGWLMLLVLLLVFMPGTLSRPTMFQHCALWAQDFPLPPDGNPGHVEPAPGAQCKHDARDPSHNCLCHRECRQALDDEGNVTTGQYVVEDPKCRVYCFKDHCACPIANCD